MSTKNSLMLKICFGMIISTSIWACFLPIPASVHMLIMTTTIIYIGSHNSVPEDGKKKEGQEQLETKDAMMLPVFASGVLLSLYLVFKFCKKEFALLLKAYFLVFGIVIVGNIFGQILSLFLPQNIVSALTSHTYHIPIPSKIASLFSDGKEDKSSEDKSSEDKSSEDKSSEDTSSEVKPQRAQNTEDKSSEDKSSEDKSSEDKSSEDKSSEDKSSEDKSSEEKKGTTLDLSNLDIIGYVGSTLIAIWCLCNEYTKDKFWTDKWLVNNIFGSAFSIQWIALFGMGSYFNGIILLCGLFFYDIFWVFGTDVMVSVAKGFDAPIKLLFPQMGEDRPSMLGLGDIVIPGAFIALMLRFDYYLAQQNKKDVSKTYFHTILMFYIAGLTTTLLIMYQFKAAQPALLYLVPACLIGSMGCALIRGNAKVLWSYEENNDDDAKKKK